MKRIVAVLLLAVVLPIMAQGQIRSDVNLGLIPTPQSVAVDMSGKVCVWKKAKVKEVGVDNYEIDIRKSTYLRQVQANIDQAYVLHIEPKQITIEYYDLYVDGVKYAYMTLEQLKRIYGDTLPCCTIIDWPAYTYRGWMDDISRGPVPHAAYRKMQWERLHALKFNFCNYYTEHTLYQPEFPDLAPAYAAECNPHPDEVINLQLFAHAEKTLRVPFYQYMMDSRANFDPSNEATYDFLRRRIKAAYDRIPNSPFFIINCDETEQLGTGRAKKLVDEKGADQVYVDFINRCYNIIREVGSEQRVEDSTRGQMLPTTHYQLPTRILMWGDIVAKNPEMMRQLPKDMTYIMWAYEPIDSFTHLIRPFKEQGNPFWVAASTGHSATMTSTPQRYIKNIANLYRDGYRDGAEGAMLTCWDDNGEALFDNSWHAQYWAAEMAWNPLKTDDPEELRQREEQFNKNFERLFYGTTLDGGSPAVLTQQLYSVGALMYNPAVGDWYTSAALMEPLLNFNPDNTNDAVVYSRVADVMKALDTIRVTYHNPHAAYALDRIRATVKKTMLRHYIYKLLKGDMQEGVDLESTIKYNVNSYFQDLHILKMFYLNLWDQENGDYERYIVMNRYDDLAREVLELDRHVFVQIIQNTQNIQSNPSNPMVQLRTLYSDRPIYYTLDGSEPTASSTLYEGPFPLERSTTIKAISYNDYGEGVISEQYLLSHLAMGAKIKLNTQYSTYKAIYSGGGPEALIDGQLGSNTTYADGHWQGYWGDSIDVTIDVGGRRSEVGVREVSMRFMQNTFDWILSPKEIKVYASKDGKEWTLVADKQFDMDPRETGMRLKNYTVPLTFPLSTSHFPLLRIVVPNPGPLPAWHPAPGQPSYLFTDEIIVK